MRQFDANTFVCFIDISGFKRELQRNLQSASNMLDTFYSAGYRTLKSYPTLNGIFVSDCGIIYPDKGKLTERLEAILKAVKDINERMLENNFLTTASIAYGHLEYKRKFVFDRMKKNAIMGNGYLNAFLDTENQTNKLIAGQVRITKQIDDDQPPANIFEQLDFNNSTLKFLEDKNSHFYYHWYLDKPSEKEKGNKVFTSFTKSKSDNKFDTLKTNLKQLHNGQQTSRK